MAQTVEGDVPEQTIRDLIGYFNTTFLRVAPIMKDSHFSEEREWRLITTSMKSTDASYDTVMSGSRMLQVYKLSFEKNDGQFDFIQSARVGPSHYPELISNALAVHLRRNDIACQSIGHSMIPYRRT